MNEGFDIKTPVSHVATIVIIVILIAAGILVELGNIDLSSHNKQVIERNTNE